MAEVVLGSVYTFQVLFVDGTNTPVVVTNPTIDVFSFSQTGVKQALIIAQAMDLATPAETGRYTYTYTIPITMDDGDSIYAEMQGTDSGTGDLYRFEEYVTVISLNRGLGSQPGMKASFIT